MHVLCSKFYVFNKKELCDSKWNEMKCTHHKWRVIFEKENDQYHLYTIFINEELGIIIIDCNIVLFLFHFFANKLSFKVNFFTAFEFHLAAINWQNYKEALLCKSTLLGNFLEGHLSNLILIKTQKRYRSFIYIKLNTLKLNCSAQLYSWQTNIYQSSTIF